MTLSNAANEMDAERWTDRAAGCKNYVDSPRKRGEVTEIDLIPRTITRLAKPCHSLCVRLV